jgi:SAM-dependent methyltransferase
MLRNGSAVISPRLQQFLDEAPVARAAHVPFLREAAASLPRGARVLDVGSGDAPYRELFDGLDYVTCDWVNSLYQPETPPDIEASADSIPLADATVDAVVCTQALEHMTEPWLVLEEFHRLLRPGGSLWVTVPLVWYLHEIPHDYYRFTSYGLRYLLERAGFVDTDVQPMNDSMATVSQLMSQLSHIIGPNDDGHDEVRRLCGELLAKLAPAIESYGHLDSRWLMPISFSARATKPA